MVVQEAEFENARIAMALLEKQPKSYVPVEASYLAPPGTVRNGYGKSSVDAGLPDRAGVASLIQVNAKGPQDDHIHEDSTAAGFQSEYKRHTRFDTFTHAIEIKPIVFGTRIKVVIPRIADLLAHACLHIKLPQLSDGYTYRNNVGNIIVKCVKLVVGNVVIMEHTGDNMWATSLMNERAGHTRGLDQMLSRHGTMYGINGQQQDMYIPIQLWDRATMQQFFPICTMYNQEVSMEVTLNDMNTLYMHTQEDNAIAVEMSVLGSRVQLSINIVPTGSETVMDESLVTSELILEYIQIDDTERRMFMSSEHEFMYETLKEQSMQIQSNTFTMDLEFNLPVKQLIFVIHEAENAHDSVGFVDNYQIITENYVYAPIKDAKIMLDDIEIGPLSHGHLVNTQAYYHNIRIPLKNLYTYSFALDPHQVQPTGCANFARFSKKVLKVRGDIKGKYIHVYALCYNILKTSNGHANVKYL